MIRLMVPGTKINRTLRNIDIGAREAVSREQASVHVDAMLGVKKIDISQSFSRLGG